MQEAEIKKLLDARISRERAKQLLIELVRVSSPQTELLENEPLLKEFIAHAVAPRLSGTGFADIRYDPMGNLLASWGKAQSGKSLMLIGNAMNQPAATMPNPYNGDVVDGAKYGLPGECVMGKGASEQKANLAAGEVYDLQQKRDMAMKAYEAVLTGRPDSGQADQARRYLKEAYRE